MVGTGGDRSAIGGRYPPPEFTVPPVAAPPPFFPVWDLRPYRLGRRLPKNDHMAVAAPPRRRRTVEVARRMPIPLGRAVAVLQDMPHQVVGSDLQAPWTGPDESADISVQFVGRQVTRRVCLGFGPLLDDDGVLGLPVWWEDAEHPALFPTFDGGLELRGDASATELRLVGSYQPPLGSVGRFADSVVGHRLVLASLDAFLTAVTSRLVALAAGS